MEEETPEDYVKRLAREKVLSVVGRIRANLYPHEAKRSSVKSVDSSNVDAHRWVVGADTVVVKDENVCLHCGLCAERCPTGAWDMQKFLLEPEYAGPVCRTPASGAKAA